jgi:hypothetical protein
MSQQARRPIALIQIPQGRIVNMWRPAFSEGLAHGRLNGRGIDIVNNDDGNGHRSSCGGI